MLQTYQNDRVAARVRANKASVSKSTSQEKRRSVLHPLVDFWALGGLSLLLFVVLQIANLYRNELPMIQMRFIQMGAVFSVLSVVCNHPHFMVSYRFGYGRGLTFILKNWFQLIAVPLAMIASYAVAYFYYDTDISGSVFIEGLNKVVSALGLSFKFGQSPVLGGEIVGLSIWLMYLTVGWHYCKQVYGCMMVYAFYDGYELGPRQRQVIKSSVVSVAIYQFVFMATALDKLTGNGTIQDQRFQGFYMSAIGLPQWVTGASTYLLVIATFGALMVIVYKYGENEQKPSINFLVPWIAFYVWWVPFNILPEYYILMIPLFHSLQYLPFAMRVEEQSITKNKWYNFRVSMRFLGLIAVAWLAFEFVPTYLG